MSGTVIRRVEPGDLPALLEIYNHYVRETAITFDVEPRSLAQRQAWLDSFATGGRYQCFVAARNDKAVGWASSHRYNERAAYETTVESSVYCRVDAVGRGIGTRLYEALFESIGAEDVHQIVAGVSLPNPASVALHERVGFRRVGVFEHVGRKFGRYWDVAWFQRPLKL